MGKPKYFFKSIEQKRNYILLGGFLACKILTEETHDGLCELLNSEQKEDRYVAEAYVEETLLNYGYMKFMANKK